MHLYSSKTLAYSFLFGGIVFGFGNWDYALAAAVGLVAGGASNGVYDWSAISNIIDKFYEWFHPTKTVK